MLDLLKILSIVVAVIIIWEFLKNLKKPKPKFVVERIEYRENENRIKILMKNIGRAKAEDVYFRAITENRIFRVTSTAPYNIKEGKKTTIIKLINPVPWPPDEQWIHHINAEKRTSGNTKVKIIIDHSTGSYTKVCQLEV